MERQTEGAKKRVSDGAFRHYVFETSELLVEAERFLKQVGYELKPTAFIGLVQPDFRAKRKTDSGSYEVVGLVRENLDQAVEALVRLAAIKAARRELDCVLVLPPANEYLLIEFLSEGKGRWYFGIKDTGLMVWFCNPDEHTTMCAIGAPADRDFQKHFYMSKISFDGYMATRGAHILQERLLAEEEEDD
ncbi:MAG: hypothetical protein DRI39_00175 [Chloroflexi bacterium]|mgnify:CR=1 FL=1|nr:MAG: hypothetical protein DRI39_00175 [Chloroflexota bacterium]